jgi:hypothetical protein
MACPDSNRLLTWGKSIECTRHRTERTSPRRWWFGNKFSRNNPYLCLRLHTIKRISHQQKNHLGGVCIILRRCQYLTIIQSQWQVNELVRSTGRKILTRENCYSEKNLSQSTTATRLWAGCPRSCGSFSGRGSVPPPPPASYSVRIGGPSLG